MGCQRLHTHKHTLLISLLPPGSSVSGASASSASRALSRARMADPEAAEAVVDPEDIARGDLESDDEIGPPEQDDEEDARALHGHEANEEDEANEDGGAEGAAAAVDPAALLVAPELPASVKTLKVPELKVHLRWRGLSESERGCCRRHRGIAQRRKHQGKSAGRRRRQPCLLKKHFFYI